MYPPSVHGMKAEHMADVSNVVGLLLYSLDDLEDIAREKGGVRQLLDEKWHKGLPSQRRTRPSRYGGGSLPRLYTSG